MTQSTQVPTLALNNPYFSSVEKRLEPLPYPVYFITKDPRWQDLIENPEAIPSEQLYEQCIHTNDIWSVQVYLDLKRRGLNVYLASEPVAGQICVFPYYYLKPKELPFKSYVVGCWHDCPEPKICDQRIVLNRSKVLDPTFHFLPHRPQPCLQPRHQSRGATVRNLVFKGHDYNLYAPFRTPEFLSELADLDINLVVSRDDDDIKFTDWCDYTEADVVLAVRNSTQYDIHLKPALKLINAWFAGCPAILGPEPSYQAMRKSSLDYIEVRTPEEAIRALKYLKENPDLYIAMIENGFQRAREFTVDCNALNWRNLLAGPITQGYEQWRRQSFVQNSIVRPIQYLLNTPKHKRARQEYVHNIEYGTRILSDDTSHHQLVLPTRNDAERVGLTHYRAFQTDI